MKTVNTVLGPLETSKIGFALMHDHILASIGGVPANLSGVIRERL